MKKILSLIFLIGLSLIIPAKTSALTDLNPGELFIISVNSDTTYPSGTNSNAFDFVTTVDLDPNTVIYFTDIAWTGTGWKNPIGEGLLRYTAPVAGLPKGTIVRYDDMLGSSSPWERLSMNPVTGIMTPGGSYDPAAGGDNILVFQGDGLSPEFLYGIGWAITTPWISTGITTSNNSYIPAALSIVAHTIVSLGNLDNYQYNCVNTGLLSTTLGTDIATPGNWNVSDSTMFGSSTCIFSSDAPELISLVRQSPLLSVTNGLSVTFRALFSESVTHVSVDDFELDPSSLIATVSGITTVSGTEYDVVVDSYTGDGSLNLDITTTNDIVNTFGNSLVSLIPQTLDESYTVDTTDPAAPGVTAPVSPTNDSTPTISGTSEANAQITLVINGQTYTTFADGFGVWSLDVTTSLVDSTHAYTVTATDTAGNISIELGTTLVIDTTAPATSVPDLVSSSDSGVSSTDNITNDTTPSVEISCVDGNTVELSIDSVALAPQTCSGSIVTSSLTLFEGDYVLSYTETDPVGNISLASTTLILIIDTTVPTSPTVDTPAEVALTGTGEDESTVVVTTASGSTCSATVVPAGTWSCTLVPNPVSGESGTVTATDIAGNTTALVNFQIKERSSGGSAVKFVCKDQVATNYSAFGRHQQSLCEYEDDMLIDDNQEEIDNSTLTPTKDNPFGGEQCSPELIITDNMKFGDTDGHYSSYNKGIIKQIALLQVHINRIFKDTNIQVAGPVDDYFRIKTKVGVMFLQIKLNELLEGQITPLVVDGIVGPFTKKAINHSC